MFSELTDELLDLEATEVGPGRAFMRGSPSTRAHRAAHASASSCARAAGAVRARAPRQAARYAGEEPLSAAVPAYPRLKPWLRQVAADGAITLGDGDHPSPRDQATTASPPPSLPELDGRRTVDQLADELGSAARRSREQPRGSLTGTTRSRRPAAGRHSRWPPTSSNDERCRPSTRPCACVSATADRRRRRRRGHGGGAFLASYELGDVRRGAWDDHRARRSSSRRRRRPEERDSRS